MAKTVVLSPIEELDRQIEAKRAEVLEIRNSLRLLDQQVAPGLELKPSEPLPLYDQIKQKLSHEQTRNEANAVIAELRSQLPNLERELHDLQQRKLVLEHQEDYQRRVAQMQPIVEEFNQATTAYIEAWQRFESEAKRLGFALQCGNSPFIPTGLSCTRQRNIVDCAQVRSPRLKQ